MVTELLAVVDTDVLNDVVIVEITVVVALVVLVELIEED